MLTPSDYPGLDFTEAAVNRLLAIPQKLDAHPNKDEILKALHEQLLYLSNYGEDRYRVSIHTDWGDWNFSLYWHATKSSAGWPGGLQFNGVRDPFNSVLLGPPTWWSVHT